MKKLLFFMALAACEAGPVEYSKDNWEAYRKEMLRRVESPGIPVNPPGTAFMPNPNPIIAGENPRLEVNVDISVSRRIYGNLVTVLEIWNLTTPSEPQVYTDEGREHLFNWNDSFLIRKGHSYNLDFFSDLNDNKRCDLGEFAWRYKLVNIDRNVSIFFTEKDPRTLKCF